MGRSVIHLAAALFLSLGLTAEAISAWHVMQSYFGVDTQIVLPLALHLAGALLTAEGLYIVEPAPINRFFPILYLVMILFIPFLGLPAAAALVLFRRLGPRRGGRYLASHDFMSDRFKITEERSYPTTVEEIVRYELLVQSYADIIRSTDRNLKKALIGRLTEDYNSLPVAVSLLKQALADGNYDIRSYASTALSRIEDRIAGSIGEMSDKLDLEPENVELRIRLIQTLTEYATSGLVDEVGKDHYLERAEILLNEFRRRYGQEAAGVRLELAEAYICRARGDSGAELKSLERVLREQPDRADVLFNLCDVLFRRREFDSLVKYSGRIMQIKEAAPEIKAPASLWHELE